MRAAHPSAKANTMHTAITRACSVAFIMTAAFITRHRSLGLNHDTRIIRAYLVPSINAASPINHVCTAAIMSSACVLVSADKQSRTTPNHSRPQSSPPQQNSTPSRPCSFGLLHPMRIILFRHCLGARRPNRSQKHRLLWTELSE